MYTLNGTFLGIKDINGGEIQLCLNTDQYLDAAYEFGTAYAQDVSHGKKIETQIYGGLFSHLLYFHIYFFCLFVLQLACANSITCLTCSQE